MEYKFNVIDLFSGVGGLSHGFKVAGFNVVLANEINPTIAESYRRNNPDTLMINVDIKDLVDNFDRYINQFEFNKDLLNHIDVIIGGPPCQGFSMAGGRIRKANEFIEDERNFLFKYYFKMIQKFEPSFFVFENVTGILSSNGGDIIRQIISIFSDPNNLKKGAYHLSINVLNAADFGVPQNRKRVLIIGSKSPFNFQHIKELVLPTLPKEKIKIFSAHPSVKDAIFDLAHISPFAANNIPNHVATKHSEKALARIRKIKPNQNWTALDEEIKSVHSGSYGRLDWNKAATTITTRFDTPSAGRYIHPSLDRTLTPREAARIQTFPDDFIFFGSKSSICTQIGNAVPPRLAEYIAYMIRYLLNNESIR
ncbi:MAG: DNA cytosine methyltransferase [Muribaculaceae bacterium]|nr:DNA cytosine methyltransferase [Muribaculaceae bacterium]